MSILLLLVKCNVILFIIFDMQCVYCYLFDRNQFSLLLSLNVNVTHSTVIKNRMEKKELVRSVHFILMELFLFSSLLLFEFFVVNLLEFGWYFIALIRSFHLCMLIAKCIHDAMSPPPEFHLYIIHNQ